MTAALLFTATLTGWVAQAGTARAGTARADTAAQEPTFAVRLPGALKAAGPVDGRVILLLSRDLKREPRSHVSPNMPLDSPYTFGINVEGLAAGHEALVDRRAFGWPAPRL